MLKPGATVRDLGTNRIGTLQSWQLHCGRRRALVLIDGVLVCPEEGDVVKAKKRQGEAGR